MRNARIEDSKKRRLYREHLRKLDRIFLPREIKYPQCSCNDSMCPAFCGGKLIFVCRKGHAGCRGMMSVEQWDFRPLEDASKIPEDYVLNDPTIMLQKMLGDAE